MNGDSTEAGALRWAKSSTNCPPAPPADPYAEYRPSQDRDQKRRREQDRQRLVELEITERHEVEDGRAEQQHRAAELQQRPSGPQQTRPADRIGEHERNQEGADV